MRDIRSEGDMIVNGNITVNESSRDEYIPFDQMNVEQLEYNLRHHQKLAAEERNGINETSKFLLGIALIAGVVIAIWYFFNGGVTNSMFFIGLVSIGMPLFLAIKNGEQTTVFEQRQLNTIQYIEMLIRERK